jgi:hypothetical protein
MCGIVGGWAALVVEKESEGFGYLSEFWVYRLEINNSLFVSFYERVHVINYNGVIDNRFSILECTDYSW